MKKCPACGVGLVREQYEGQVLDRCPECDGMLVKVFSLEGIKRARGRTEGDLEAEAGQFTASSHAEVQCPQCFRQMGKETTNDPPFVEYDRCPSCKVVWFDPGELAMLQLSYESTDAARDAEQYRQRLCEVEASPERKARFEQNVARLPEEDLSPLSAVGRGFLAGLLPLLRTRHRRFPF